MKLTVYKTFIFMAKRMFLRESSFSNTISLKKNIYFSRNMLLLVLCHIENQKSKENKVR